MPACFFIPSNTPLPPLQKHVLQHVLKNNPEIIWLVSGLFSKFAALKY